MKRLLTALAIGLVAATGWNMPAHAAPSLTLTTHFTLPAEGQTVDVEHRIQAKGGGEVQLELPVRDVRDATLRAEGGGGSNPQVRTEAAEAVHQGTLLHTTKFTFSTSGSGTLILSYQTDSVLRRYGANSAMLWSNFAKGGVQEKVTVSVPGKLGRPSIFGLPSSDSSFEGGKTRFDFSTTNAKQPVKLIFGANGLWELDWSSVSLRNDGWWFRDAYIILPADTNQQRVWLESISPTPRRLSVDRDGNLIAQYRLWPKRTISFSAKAFVETRALFYNTSNTRPLADVPGELKEYTLTSSKLVEDTQVLAQVRKYYARAAKTAREREGNAERITSDGREIVGNLVENLRRNGIPAREVSGVALANREQLLPAQQPSFWAETYVPGTGWMTVDPLDEQYGMADPLHLGLVISGLPSPVPLSAQLDGLAITPYIQGKLPDPRYSEAQVAMTRFIVVPGLSINRTQVRMPAGIVLDNAATTADGRQVAFGSLAPLQRMGRWSASVGSESWRGGSIQFGRGGEQGLGEVLSQGSVRTNYLLVAAELLVLVLGGWWIARRRRRRGSAGKVPPLEKQLTDDTIATDDLLRRQ